MKSRTIARLGLLATAALLVACMPQPFSASGSVNVGTSGQQAGNQQGGGDKPSATPSANAVGQKAVKDVTIAPQSLVIPVNTSRDVTATVSYMDGTKNSDVTWSSSDDTIINVNRTTGKVTALKQGNASIVAVSNVDGTKSANVSVSVRPAESSAAFAKIDPTEATIEVEQSMDFNAEIKESDGTVTGDVKWTVSDSSIAVISGSGASAKVTGIKAGSVTITAQATGDPTKKATAKVTVKAKGS